MGPAPKRLRVIVTRAREQLEPLAGRLEALGYDVVRCPLIELQPIGPEQLDVEGYDWVVVTSPFAAREVLRRARGPLPAVAAIGPGTAAALAEGGVEAALVPQVSTQEGLLAELPQPSGRVLFAGAERATFPTAGNGLEVARRAPARPAGGSEPELWPVVYYFAADEGRNDHRRLRRRLSAFAFQSRRSGSGWRPTLSSTRAGDNGSNDSRCKCSAGGQPW